MNNDKTYYHDTHAHLYTTNEYFKKLTKRLSEDGVVVPLHTTLYNKHLIDVDPFDKNLTDEQKEMILQECKDNPFYFLGECVRIPMYGGDSVGLRLHKGTMASVFLTLNSVSSYNVSPIYTSRTNVQTALILWYRLFSKKFISYINYYGREALLARLNEFYIRLPDFIIDATKLIIGDITLYCPRDETSKITDLQARVITMSDIVFIDDFEFLHGVDKILKKNISAVINISTTVGDPEIIDYNPQDLIDKCSVWNIAKHLDGLYIPNFKRTVNGVHGEMFYIETGIEEIDDNPEEWLKERYRMCFEQDDVYQRHCLLNRSYVPEGNTNKK